MLYINCKTYIILCFLLIHCSFLFNLINSTGNSFVSVSAIPTEISSFTFESLQLLNKRHNFLKMKEVSDNGYKIDFVDIEKTFSTVALSAKMEENVDKYSKLDILKQSCLNFIRYFEHFKFNKVIIKSSLYLFLWYFFTVVYNISNKNLLNDIDLPYTIAALQLVGGIPLFLPLWIFKPIKYDFNSWKLHSKISLMHGLGNIASVISFGSGSVGFAHIIKALEPAVAALLSATLYRQYFPISIYLSLIPIIGGVALASVTELSFTWLCLFSALLSNFFYQMRMVLAKHEISGEKQKISAANLFRIITIFASIQVIPIALIVEGFKMHSVYRMAIENGSSHNTIVSNLLISSISYYMYNEVAFWLLDIVHPITHAIGNTIKRVVLIFVSVVIFKSPMTTSGLSGAFIAIVGTLVYSILQQSLKSNNSK